MPLHQRDCALTFIGDLLSVWAFSRRRTDSGVGIGFPVKSLPSTQDNLGFDHRQLHKEKQKQKELRFTGSRHVRKLVAMTSATREVGCW